MTEFSRLGSFDWRVLRFACIRSAREDRWLSFQPRAAFCFATGDAGDLQLPALILLSSRGGGARKIHHL